jgi:hypothetical protein
MSRIDTLISSAFRSQEFFTAQASLVELELEGSEKR